MRRVLVGLAFAAGVLAAGCGDVPRSSLHGKVTYRGKPIGPATLIFLAADNKTHTADLDADGNYRVSGVARGPVRVSVQQALPHIAPRPDPAPGRKGGAVGESKDGRADRDDPPPSAPKELANPLPPRFADPAKSGLAFDVTQPDQEWSADLK